MFVRAKVDFDCPSHRIPKGGMADIPEVFAKAGISSGELEPVDTEKAIKQIAGAETRGRSTTRKRRDGGDDLPGKSE